MMVQEVVRRVHVCSEPLVAGTVAPDLHHHLCEGVGLGPIRFGGGGECDAHVFFPAMRPVAVLCTGRCGPSMAPSGYIHAGYLLLHSIL